MRDREGRGQREREILITPVALRTLIKALLCEQKIPGATEQLRDGLEWRFVGKLNVI